MRAPTLAPKKGAETPPQKKTNNPFIQRGGEGRGRGLGPKTGAPSHRRKKARKDAKKIGNQTPRESSNPQTR